VARVGARSLPAADESFELPRRDRALTRSATPSRHRAAAVDSAGELDDRLVRRYWLVRLVFGAVWAVDATLKWLPGFRHDYLGSVRASAAGQPGWLHFWFHFWVRLATAAPTMLAVLTAVTETAICLSLLLGLLQRVGFVAGTVFSFLIWGVGEGFGGPYMNGSTDIGCAIMYSALFVSLAVTVPRPVRAAAPSLDARLLRRWPRLVAVTFQHE
jgi:thiosulfate dehydrogenase (quinone) large subunit